METTKVTNADVGTALAHERTDMAGERTDLALERNYMASERTLMAWIRTALSMITFGFTIGKLRDIMQGREVTGVLGRTRNVSTQDVAAFLVTLGTISLFLAGIQYVLDVHRLRRRGLHRRVGLTLYVALALMLLGGFALTALVRAF